MVNAVRQKVFQSLITIDVFLLLIVSGYKAYSGNDFFIPAPGIILFVGFLALSIAFFSLLIIDFPFVMFIKEVYSLATGGSESQAIKYCFRAANCCLALYCSVQASSVIGSMFHVSWTSLPFTSVIITSIMFAPGFICFASFVSTITFYRRSNSEAVKNAVQPSNGMHNVAGNVLIMFLFACINCWYLTFNTYGKVFIESFAFSYDFQSHSCVNISDRNVVYISSNHTRVLVRIENPGRYDYSIHECKVLQ